MGDIWQKPPAYSALRVNGQRAYDLARFTSSLFSLLSHRPVLMMFTTLRRAGEEVDLPARQVRVHAVQLVDFKPPYFTVRIECGGGFYVRKLVQVRPLPSPASSSMKRIPSSFFFFLCRT